METEKRFRVSFESNGKCPVNPNGKHVYSDGEYNPKRGAWIRECRCGEEDIQYD